MTKEQRERAEKLAAIISAHTMSAESKLKKAIKACGEAVALADEVADASGSDNDKKIALRTRAHQERLKASLASTVATHCEASILQCDALDIPMTRGGDR